jgi:hypothetical protein
MVDNQVVTFAAPVSSFIEFRDQTTMDNTVTIDRVWYNNPGFVVIYADNGHGGAGKVIGQTAIQPGLNANVVVELTADDIATGTIFPILHEDTGEVGVYEFGSVDDVDLPVRLNNRAVAGELALTVEMPEMAEGV